MRSCSTVVWLFTVFALTACNRGTALIGGEPTPTLKQVGLALPATVSGSIEVNGAVRTYGLYVPESADPLTPAPLVVALHGGGGNGENMQAHVGLDAVADREGFLVAYPDGSGRLENVLLTWNAGNCCGYALDQDVDDVAFIRALVREVASTYSVDPRRVYATGMSNGAMMAYRLACEASDLFAAIAPVAGALNVDCQPSEPVSVLAIHGTADEHVLFEGGEPQVSLDSHARVDQSVEYAMWFWAARDGCRLSPMREQAGDVIHEVYPDCGRGLAVELLAIVGGRHAWPGGSKFTARGDEPSNALDASEAMWAFFEAHPKP